jgi:hypothetical protein
VVSATIKVREHWDMDLWFSSSCLVYINMMHKFSLSLICS